VDISLRCYVDNKTNRKDREELYYNKRLTFVFDVEAVPDPYMELIFGSYSVYEDDRVIDTALFYGDVTKEQLRTLKRYSESHGIRLMSRDEFAERFIFYVYDRRAVCVGMNLSFDISRIAIYFNTSKTDSSAFSFKITDNECHPRIYIRHLNSHHSFIRFIAPYAKNKKNKNKYPGVFVDLKTLTFALTNKSHNLESACKLFKVEHQKLKAEQHGKITDSYILYNLFDVKCSFDLYKALVRRVEEYDIPAQPYELVSPAAIGPAYYRAMNIKPFMQQNPNFSKDLMGLAMTCYYGGRVETHIRLTATPATCVDASAMYASNYCRMNLAEINICNELLVEDDPEFRDFIENIKLEDLTDLAIWRSKLRGIALVELDDDVFPIRGKFGTKVVSGIGVNYAKGKQLWFSYPDIVGSFLLSGKVPKIVKSYKFVPRGIQPTLKPIKLFGKIIDPRETDLIKYLVERRLEIKKMLKNDPNNESLKNEDQIAKGITASCSYGKFLQINTRDTRPVKVGKTKKKKPVKVDVYGFEHFKASTEKLEYPGELFNPLIGILATGGARLILAMSEAFIKSRGCSFCAMDTDSVFLVDPAGVPSIVDDFKAFFKPLSPYSQDADTFKVEKADDGTPLDHQLCFCVSSKRYCWFKRTGSDIQILKASSHGLGFMLDMREENVIEFWKNIIKFHEGKLTRQDIENKYAGKVVMQQLTITSPQVLSRFKGIANNGKRKMRPFSFMITGQAYRINPKTSEPIIPVVPFTKDRSTVQYQPFFDLKTGKVYSENTDYYWKPLSEVFFDFYNHEEQKFDGDIGELTRKHIVIDDINFVGKETNDLEASTVTGALSEDQIYYNKDQEQKIMKRIETLTIEEARSAGISDWQFYYLKKKASVNEMPKFKRKTLSKFQKLV
jgi:hypothetical protein